MPAPLTSQDRHRLQPDAADCRHLSLVAGYTRDGSWSVSPGQHAETEGIRRKRDPCMV